MDEFRRARPSPDGSNEGFVDVTPGGAWSISSWAGSKQEKDTRGPMGSNERWGRARVC